MSLIAYLNCFYLLFGPKNKPKKINKSKKIIDFQPKKQV